MKFFLSTLAIFASFSALAQVSELETEVFKKRHEISAINKKGQRFLKIYTIGTVKTERDDRAVFLKDILIPISAKVEISENGIDAMDLDYSRDDLDLATGQFYNTKNRLTDEIFENYKGTAQGIGVGIAYHANSQAKAPNGIQFHDMSSGGIFGGLMWDNGVGLGVRKTPFNVTLAPKGSKATVNYKLIEHGRVYGKKGYVTKNETKTIPMDKILRMPLPAVKFKSYPVTGFGF